MKDGNKTWREILQANQPRYLGEMIELLRIPSVSAARASVPDVQHAADWVSRRLQQAGVENIAVLPTGEHACVYGDWLHAPGKPTILIYGHFDVQPPDPLGLWDSPPFEPVIKDGCIFARGASDMKGNLLLSIAAVEAMLAANGSLPVNVKFLFEGQEEIGSRDLPPFVAAHRALLACDLILSADGLQWSETEPALWLGIKGMCGLQIDLETAALDLHSGAFGGAVPNAAHALVELLATVRNRDGLIQVEGFFEQVRPLTAAERAALGEVPFDATAYRTELGVDALVGEPGYTTQERAWARPTLEVNGLWGGYQGDGVKTVIPARAHAKTTCRLVPNQDPEVLLGRLEEHFKRHCPAGARLTLTRSGSTALPYEIPREHPGIKITAGVLAEVYQRPPYYTRIGGSLPITAMFLQELNAHTIMLGFGLFDERAHSPNEFYRLANFERGQIVYARMLEQLAGYPRQK